MSLIKKTTVEIFEKRRLDTYRLTKEEQQQIYEEINDGGWFIEYGSPESKTIYRTKRSE